MKQKRIGLALGLVALALTGAAVLPARADDNDNDNVSEDTFELLELDSRRDVVVVRCDERLIQAEQVSEGLMVITCGARVIDDTVRTKTLKHKRW
jgi:hypothetical protein